MPGVALTGLVFAWSISPPRVLKILSDNLLITALLITALDKSKELAQIPCVTHSTLTSKNQTTIPKAVVEALKLRPSDQLTS